MGKKITLFKIFQNQTCKILIVLSILSQNIIYAQSVTASEPGPLVLSPGVGEKILFNNGELAGTLNSVSIIATYTNGSNNVYANDLAVFVLDGPTTILQIGGYTHLVVGGERKEWKTGATSAFPTTFSDTQILDNPITFNPNDSHKVAIALGNYSTGAAGTWESVTVVLNGLSKSTADRYKVDKNQLSAFPNPSSDVLNVTNTNPMFIDNLQIINVEGKVVKKINSIGHFTQLNISDLPSGVYNLIATSSEKNLIEKFVKL